MLILYTAGCAGSIFTTVSSYVAYALIPCKPESSQLNCVKCNPVFNDTIK